MTHFFKKHILQHRNNKFLYYAGGVLRNLYPRAFLNLRARLRPGNTVAEQDYLLKRLNYYNKLNLVLPLSDKAISLAELNRPQQGTVYYFDTVEYTRYFNQTLKAHFLFGDITHIPDEPCIVKSRPISDVNENSVLLKLNKIRHFTFVEDDTPFESKLNKLVWRGFAVVEHRIRFLNMYFNHPLCNLGKINATGDHDEWMTGRLSINEHLRYKFILCIEGNDVASNLKWVMSSNSVAVMPKPSYETWFMEGTLIPNYHYIQIREDFSDVEEKLTYYINHPEEAKQIVQHANEYVDQFKNKKREDLLSLLVLEKYFVKTGQIEPISELSIDNRSV